MAEIETVLGVFDGLVQAERLAYDIKNYTTDPEAAKMAGEIKSILTAVKQKRDLAVIHVEHIRGLL